MKELKSRKKRLSITKGLTNAVEEFLGSEGIVFFKNVRKNYGKVDAIWFEEYKNISKPIPHIVYFMEGMMVRNFMRSTGLCKRWSSHDYDEGWIDVVESILDKYVDSETLREIDEKYEK